MIKLSGAQSIIEEQLDMTEYKRSSLIEINAVELAKRKLRELREEDSNEKRHLEKQLKMFEPDLHANIEA